jgi:hypothetical protein
MKLRTLYAPCSWVSGRIPRSVFIHSLHKSPLLMPDPVWSPLTNRAASVGKGCFPSAQATLPLRKQAQLNLSGQFQLSLQRVDGGP